jgi:hypothetical protein
VCLFRLQRKSPQKSREWSREWSRECPRKPRAAFLKSTEKGRDFSPVFQRNFMDKKEFFQGNRASDLFWGTPEKERFSKRDPCVRPGGGQKGRRAKGEGS